MIYRIFPSKDTFITNNLYRGTQRTGSNFGSSEILHLYKEAGTSGAIGVTATASLTRILMQFDLTSLHGIVPSGSVFYLKLFDAQHDYTLPSSYDVEVQALSQSWDEGKGHDVDDFADRGFANWVKAKTNQYWTTAGGTATGPIANFHLDDGHESLEVDVTPIVNQWLSGNITNNGLMVRLSSTLETDFNDYYIKMFHGRETFFKDKRPCLEARWDNFISDNRNNFVFGVSGTLFLYHSVRGQLQNIDGVGTGNIGVRISDLSGSVLVVTGSYAGRTGTYSASFAIPTGSYSGSLFTDVWFDLDTPTRAIMSGNFGIGNDVVFEDVSPKRYFVNVSNLKNTYQVDEVVRLKMFVRPNDYNPSRVLTASLDSNGTVISKAYYEIRNDRTDEIVVPLGTGSLQHTRLSYDQKGNYFDFHMKNLAPGNVYRLSFLFEVDGQRQYIGDNHFKFRVIE